MESILEKPAALAPLGAHLSDIIIDKTYELETVTLPKAMRDWIERIEWPAGNKYKANKSFKPKDIIYDIDFDCPIEEITEAHYGNADFAGLVAIAVTDHGQLVVNPKDDQPGNPIIYFLDNDDEESYDQWKARKIRLLDFLDQLESE